MHLDVKSSRGNEEEENEAVQRQMACFIFNVLLMELAVGITRLALRGHVHQRSASSIGRGGAEGWGQPGSLRTGNIPAEGTG